MRNLENSYEKIDVIGEGAFGVVYKAKDIKTGEVVAIKTIKSDSEGFPITSIREISLLRKLSKSRNIVRLKEVIPSCMKGNENCFFMVLEYLENDLTGLLYTKSVSSFKVAEIKCLLKQLLEGVHYAHVNKVLHRDIKASNILISKNGILKLADFGLARSIEPYPSRITDRVVTRWYRSPELLFGTDKYGTGVDMWSVGCVFGELLLRKPLFPGKDELDQIDKIFSLCGTPTNKTWSGVENLPKWKECRPKTFYRNRIPETFRQFSPQAVDLLCKMLTLDPAQRISADQALDHDYFWSDPMPVEPEQLPQYSFCTDKKVRETEKQKSKVQSSGAPPRPHAPHAPHVPHGHPMHPAPGMAPWSKKPQGTMPPHMKKMHHGPKGPVPFNRPPVPGAPPHPHPHQPPHPRHPHPHPPPPPPSRGQPHPYPYPRPHPHHPHPHQHQPYPHPHGGPHKQHPNGRARPQHHPHQNRPPYKRRHPSGDRNLPFAKRPRGPSNNTTNNNNNENSQFPQQSNNSHSHRGQHHHNPNIPNKHSHPIANNGRQ